jgi:hypothetical protein
MKWTHLLAVGYVALGASTCIGQDAIKKQKGVSVTDLPTIYATRCVGRFLIDIPSDVVPFGKAKVRGVTLNAEPMDEAHYHQTLAETEAELKRTKSALGYQFLYDYGAGPIKGSQYFVHLKSIAEPSDSSRTIDAYKWDNGYKIKLSITGFDFTKSTLRDTPSVKKMSTQNDVPEKARLVFDLLGQVRGRPDDDIPSAPGVCFLGGYIPGKANEKEKENISMQFVVRSQPDVSFSVETDSDIQEETSLLQRGDQINAMLKDTDGGRTIRKGYVDLTGLIAEEWLMAGKSPWGVQGQSFMLEANSKIGSSTTPLVGVDMRNGWPPPEADRNRVSHAASLTENQAIALWDSVSRTLRPRPNGF